MRSTPALACAADAPAPPRRRRALPPRRSPGTLVRVNGHWYPAGGFLDRDATERPGASLGAGPGGPG